MLASTILLASLAAFTTVSASDFVKLDFTKKSVASDGSYRQKRSVDVPLINGREALNQLEYW